MKIYTKTGDHGETSLYGGQRIPKDALRIEAYGSVDELNSCLGMIVADSTDPDIIAILTNIQRRLFDMGADLAAPPPGKGKRIRRIAGSDARALERTIDGLEKNLRPLRNFILPGGTPAASRLHFARTVCRRAERVVVRLSRHEKIGAAIPVYLNRLSDLLFVLARFANHRSAIMDVVWKP